MVSETTQSKGAMMAPASNQYHSRRRRFSVSAQREGGQVFQRYGVGAQSPACASIAAAGRRSRGRAPQTEPRKPKPSEQLPISPPQARARAARRRHVR